MEYRGVGTNAGSRLESRITANPSCQFDSPQVHGIKETSMRYLGGISGHGELTCDGEPIARASYEFDGYFEVGIGVTSCGEIRLPADALKGVFGRSHVQLLTDDGRLLDLRFSDKKLLPAISSASVDVTGQLPSTPGDWRS